jgi:glycosyltransferase involved in cell wall biosynthesis
MRWLDFIRSQDFYAGVPVCLICPVWPESLPRTLLEQICAGCATIYSTAGGIPEMTGVFQPMAMYQRNKHRLLAELILMGISEAARWKKCKPLRADFAERFTPETTREYLEMYSTGS